MTIPKRTIAHSETFLSHIDVARKTEATYRYGLQAFGDFLAGAASAKDIARDVPLTRLKEDTLAQFRHWLRHERRVSRRTEGTYLAAAIRFVEWLDASGHLAADVSSTRMKLLLRNARGRRRTGYKTQPIKEAVPLILEHYDRQALASPDTPRGRRQRLSTLRNRAAVHTLFATGLRAQELASLHRGDCADGMGDKMLITGKGEKERLVILNDEARHAIQKYLHARDADRAGTPGKTRPAAMASSSEALFVRHDRDSLAPITTNMVWYIVSQAARALGLATKISPHDFRRYMATTLLSEGMPLESVQAFLGHESIVTTRTVYAHTWDEVMDDQLKTYRPSPAQAQKRAAKHTGG